MGDTLDGTARARQVEDDLLMARLIAYSVCEREGLAWRGHRLSRDPDRIFYGKGRRPTFCYRIPYTGFSVIGDPQTGFTLVETRLGGSVVLHRVYSHSGRLLRRDAELQGDPARN